MFDSLTQIVSAVLRTIISIQGVDFQDTRILNPLFHAYACTIFTYCPPGPKAVQLERVNIHNFICFKSIVQCFQTTKV